MRFKDVIPTYNVAKFFVLGVDGLEAAIESDHSILEKDPKKYFHKYLNTCPNQGTRTIRTEEAVLISLSKLTPQFKKISARKPNIKKKNL